jgi:hypothetical protein
LSKTRPQKVDGPILKETLGEQSTCGFRDHRRFVLCIRIPQNRTSCSITREQWKTYRLSFSLGKPLDSISKFIYGRDPSFSAHVGLCDRVLSFCGATWRCPSLGWVVYQRLQWFIINPIDAIDEFELMISPRISL